MATDQPVLPMFDARASVPHKRVRAVSTERYRELVETGAIHIRQQEFVDRLLLYRQQVGAWPTMKELVTWAHRARYIVSPDPNIWRPRATELVGSIVEYLPRRICAVTGKQAHPVKVREVGSLQPR